jgi:hypothetical protein
MEEYPSPHLSNPPYPMANMDEATAVKSDDEMTLSSVFGSRYITDIELSRLEDDRPPSRYIDTLRRFRITSSSRGVYTARIGDDLKEHFEDINRERFSLHHLREVVPKLVPKMFSVRFEKGSSTSNQPHQPYIIYKYEKLQSLSPTSAKTLGQQLATKIHECKTQVGFGYYYPVYYRGIKIIDGWFGSWEACYQALITGALSHLESDEYSGLNRQVEKVKERHVFDTKYEQGHLLNHPDFIGLFLYS